MSSTVRLVGSRLTSSQNLLTPSANILSSSRESLEHTARERERERERERRDTKCVWWERGLEYYICRCGEGREKGGGGGMVGGRAGGREGWWVEGWEGWRE